MKSEIKYDIFNNIDVDFYEEKAKKLRNEYYAKAIKQAATNVKNFFANLTLSSPLKSA